MASEFQIALFDRLRYALYLAFYVDAGNPNRSFMFVWEALHQLSHLLTPNNLK